MCVCVRVCARGVCGVCACVGVCLIACEGILVLCCAVLLFVLFAFASLGFRSGLCFFAVCSTCAASEALVSFQHTAALGLHSAGTFGAHESLATCSWYCCFKVSFGADSCVINRSTRSQLNDPEFKHKL